MPIKSSLNAAIMNAANTFERMNSIASANSAASASQAKITREWQEQQNAKAMAFNQMEAAKNRNWQEYMSNTAHQREVADLKAAGLNPVLSATGGNGAAVTSGATASGVTSSGATGQVDMSMNQVLVSLLSSIYNRTTQLEAANINARTQEAVAKKYTEMSEIVANIGLEGTKYTADNASKYGLLNSLFTFVKGLFGDGDGNSSGGSNPSSAKGEESASESLKSGAKTVYDALEYFFDTKNNNDGYAWITKLFPALKKYDWMKVD